jgi:hypothetical protein
MQAISLRMFAIVALGAALGLVLALPAEAVTLNVIGSPGTNGVDGVGAPGTDGGPGGTANSVTAPNSDPSNTANATGGPGGNGGTASATATVTSRCMDSARPSQPGPKNARSILMASARQRWRTSTNQRPWQPTSAGKSSKSDASS